MSQLIQYTMTLTGAVQQGNQMLPTTPVGSLPGNQVGGPNDIACRSICLQPDGANTGVIYVGAKSTMTTSDWGIRLEAPIGTVPPPPFLLGEFPSGPIRPSDLFFLGTNADKVHVLLVPF